jgi:GMP synthase (glutamine-hydrolysing)
VSGLVIVQPGQKLSTLSAVPGDFADWMLAGMGLAPELARVVRPHLGEPLPPPDGVAAVLVTGSSAMVTDADPWIESSAAWLADLVRRQRPVLGICFGHQLLARALGGEVRDNPNGIEIGTVTSQLTAAAAADPLFRGLPAQLAVQASHRQSVLRLPEGATRLAASAQDPNHAFRWGEQAWGVQFHPEFSPPIVRAYAEYYRPQLPAQGSDADRVLRAVRDTPAPPRLLRAFARRLASDR